MSEFQTKLNSVPSGGFLTDRDKDKKPILDVRELGIDFGGLTAVDGRKLTFSAVMYDDAGEVGRATHERFIIQNEKFQKKADAKKAAE